MTQRYVAICAICQQLVASDDDFDALLHHAKGHTLIGIGMENGA